MRFIKYNIEELLFQESWKAFLDFLVVDDHDIVVIELVQHHLTFTHGAFDDLDILSFKELLDLVLPVVSECCRANHEVDRTVNDATVLLDLSLFDLLTFVENDT